MAENLRAELAINNVSIELNPFVEQFLTQTVVGAVSSLKGAETIQNLELNMEGDDVKIAVNGQELPLTPFPKDIITSTIIGLVSSLKGVKKVDSLRVKVRAA